MIKKILISVVFLLLIVVGGVYFYFDALVKSGVEVAGSSVLGTAVTVGVCRYRPSMDRVISRGCASKTRRVTIHSMRSS